MRPLGFIAVLCGCLAAAFGQPAADSLTHYNKAETFFQQHDFQDAANEFRAALDGNLDPKWIEVWSHIYLGKIFETVGQHERAMNEFRLAIATGDDTRGAQAIAASELRHGEPVDLGPLPEGVYRAGGDAIGPVPERRDAPNYSDEARLAGLEGTVFLSGIVGEDGLARGLHVKRSLGLGLDEAAMEAVARWKFAPGTRAGEPVRVLASIAVDFVLPDNFSRWHLMGVEFQPPEGATRPTFAGTFYPPGAGVSTRTVDEGWVISAIHRMATAQLSFDVDEHGFPVNFQVVKASLPLWGEEAIALVRGWRFNPGTQDGSPVSVPCTLDLVWGQKQLNPAMLAKAREALNARAPDAGDDAGQPPRVIWSVQAFYTDEARDAKLEGSVSLRVLVGADGVPKDIQVVRPLGMGLDKKAIQAVSEWRFQPALVNGRATEIQTMVEVPFRLTDQRTTIVLP